MGKKDENHQKERKIYVFFSSHAFFSVSYLWLALRVLIDNGVREEVIKRRTQVNIKGEVNAKHSWH